MAKQPLPLCRREARQLRARDDDRGGHGRLVISGRGRLLGGCPEGRVWAVDRGERDDADLRTEAAEGVPDLSSKRHNRSTHLARDGLGRSLGVARDHRDADACNAEGRNGGGRAQARRVSDGD